MAFYGKYFEMPVTVLEKDNTPVILKLRALSNAHNAQEIQSDVVDISNNENELIGARQLLLLYDDSDFTIEEQQQEDGKERLCLKLIKGGVQSDNTDLSKLDIRVDTNDVLYYQKMINNNTINVPLKAQATDTSFSLQGEIKENHTLQITINNGGQTNGLA